MKRRYGQTFVKDKKNVPRTLNCFSHQYEAISMHEYRGKGWEFTYHDSLLELDLDAIVYDRLKSEIDLTKTSKLIQAIESMFEYRLYQPFLITIVKKLEKKELVDGKEISINELFTRKKDSIVNYIAHGLETATGKQFTDHFISKLYSTIRNRVQFDSFYSSDYHSSITPYRTLTNYYIKIFQSYYNFFLEYEWLLSPEMEENLDYYDDEEPLSPNDPVYMEWRAFVMHIKRNDILNKLYKTIAKLAHYIELVSVDAEPHYFISKKGNVQWVQLKKFLIGVHGKELEEYRKAGSIHKALYEMIPIETQKRIFSYHLL